MEFMSWHRGDIAVYNDTQLEQIWFSVSEKNDHATNFPNAPRMPQTHDSNQVFPSLGTTNVKNVPYVLDWPLDQ